MLPDNYGIHEKTVKKAYGSYDVVIGRFLYALHTPLFFYYFACERLGFWGEEEKSPKCRILPKFFSFRGIQNPPE